MTATGGKGDEAATGTRELPPETARLVRGLRDLRDRTGLSLARLAEETRYSKSSWERYLNGRTLPPRRAVLALCSLADEPPARLVALWELAGRSGSTAPTTAPSAPAAAEPPPTAQRHLRTPVIAAVALGYAVVAGLVVALWPGPGGSSQPAPRCHGAACEGKSPASTFCGLQSTTLATIHATNGAELDVRYSPRCETVWARVTQSQVGEQIDITVPGGHIRAAQVTDQLDAQAYVYTPMVALGSGRDVRACLTPVHGGVRQCFTEHVPH
ncbi:DUF2690 domain-containing protein [Streptomyces sp. SID1328]|uniref:helix-turn-helix domain-containing protein n=1 Tax=Streptomyces sp. SID1328 TaxID=2690250 RepID=UPI00137122DE|nr:XRE family transcriptional regulator [Streptomyces sp. SID1328]MYV39646.1 DUF2690 domain-containing protein [Streptomyces sp. SID1328]